VVRAAQDGLGLEVIEREGFGRTFEPMHGAGKRTYEIAAEADQGCRADSRAPGPAGRGQQEGDGAGAVGEEEAVEAGAGDGALRHLVETEQFGAHDDRRHTDQ
jgi:hypothetical protein